MNENINPTLNPTDFLDAVVAESEARSPGFGARVEAALEERCRRRAEMLDSAQDETIRDGDVVCLKSGGPALTVGTITDKCVWAYWFDSFTFHKELIPRVALAKVNPATLQPNK